jgi:hypothetical protein
MITTSDSLFRERDAQSYVQEKADVFSGRYTHQGKHQSPEARIACAEETKRMESIDKAIHGMVSKSSGRNESERIGDVENPNREAEPTIGG